MTRARLRRGYAKEKAAREDRERKAWRVWAASLPVLLLPRCDRGRNLGSGLSYL